jgi:toxin CptA
MHAAPSVSYPVGRSAFAGALYLLLAGAGLAAACAWTWQSHAPGWRQALAFSLVVAGASFAASGWLRSPQGRVHWAGGGWNWEEGGASAAARVELALDLQSRMLLRLGAEGAGVRWLWAERASDPSHWDALRRAVYSRASAPIPTAPQGGEEPPPAGQPPGAEQ